MKQEMRKIMSDNAELPSDMVPVPREPTEAMMVAGWNAQVPQLGDCLLGNAYRAMLAAAGKGEK
jgi:hypothetical protein